MGMRVVLNSLGTGNFFPAYTGAAASVTQKRMLLAVLATRLVLIFKSTENLRKGNCIL